MAANGNNSRAAVEEKVAKATEADSAKEKEAAENAAAAEAKRSADLERQIKQMQEEHDREIAELQAAASARAAANGAGGRRRNSVKRPQTKVRSFDADGHEADGAPDEGDEVTE